MSGNFSKAIESGVFALKSYIKRFLSQRGTLNQFENWIPVSVREKSKLHENHQLRKNFVNVFTGISQQVALSACDARNRNKTPAFSVIIINIMIRRTVDHLRSVSVSRFSLVTLEQRCGCSRLFFGFELPGAVRLLIVIVENENKSWTQKQFVSKWIYYFLSFFFHSFIHSINHSIISFFVITAI